jgi:hypothetical protein
LRLPKAVKAVEAVLTLLRLKREHQKKVVVAVALVWQNVLASLKENIGTMVSA